MRLRRTVAATVCVGVLLLTRAVAADPASPAPVEPPTRLLTPSTVTTDGGSTLRLPRGYFLPDPTWSKLDAELKRLQATETRLTAENKSLRENDKPGWGWFAGVVMGLVGGAAGTYYLTR